MTKVDFSKLPKPVLGEHPEWVELYYKAWELAATHIRTDKSGRAYMDAAFEPWDNRQWVWDTCFMSLYCRYAPEQYPGVESLDNFYDRQSDDGFISMTYDMDTGTEPWPGYINPPLFAWVEWEYYLSTGDGSRFERVAGHIERLMDWIDANRRTVPHRRRASRDTNIHDVGESAENYQLYYFSDCGASGMDDSPRTPRIPEAGRFYDWIDLSSQMALSFRMLGRMHNVLGNSERASHWEKRAVELGGLINAELWCDRTRFYHDRMLPRNFVASKTTAGFWPMLACICDDDRLDALVEHLLDEHQFNRPTPVPTLSADDPNYTPKGVYWCGGVWAPTNYMIARGLMKAGRPDVAHEIAMKYVGAIARTYADYQPNTLWECYSPEEDLPGLTAYSGEAVKGDFVGWTGLGPIAMLIENIIGIDIDVPDRRVNWDIRLTEAHGVRSLGLGGLGRADLLCKARKSADAPAEVELSCHSDLTVRITRGSVSKTIEVQKGAVVSATV